MIELLLVDPHCDIVLVGDSVGMVLHGMASTLGVTLDMMVLHGQAVRRGLERALMVVDLPFGAYEESREQAFRSAARLLAETGCAAVKLEGGESMAGTIRFLAARGIPVMAHVGMTPQSVNALGGYRVQGRGEEAARKLLDQATNLEKAGAFSIVIEGVPAAVGSQITAELQIPTIGIGAGPGTDAQVLVINDLLGLNERVPRFAATYADLRGEIGRAVKAFAADVDAGTFPDDAHTYG